MNVPPQIDSLQNIAQELLFPVRIQRLPILGRNEQILRKTELPRSENAVSQRQQLGGAFLSAVRRVALAADGEQQRMYSGRIYGMNLLYAGNILANRVSGQFVDQLTERGVFLRRPADDRERPDCARLGIHLVHPHNRERMRQAVIAKMISERALGLRLPRINLTRNDKIGIVANAEAVRVAVAKPVARQHPGYRHLAQPLRQRHDGRKRVRRRAADEAAHLQRNAPLVRLRLVNADSPMNLIMDADFFIQLVIVAA